MLKKKDAYRVAVAGATNAVGRELIEILEERDFPVADLLPLDVEDSAGERIEFRGSGRTVRLLSDTSLTDVDIAFFATGAEQSSQFAPRALESGSVVIDSSRAFNMDAMVPLVIPEVNSHAISAHRGIIASPSASTIDMMMVLKPIHDAVTIKRIVVTTLQSVSGTGKRGMDELASQTVALLNFRDVVTSAYPHQIAFNCLPQIDTFLEDGYSTEEVALEQESRKILESVSIGITATAVRVPVFRCHAKAINIETLDAITPQETRELLARVSGVMVFDDPGKNIYPLQTDVVGKDDVYVGRIRQDKTIPHGLSLWVVSDNLRKGTALNAVQIAEHLVK